MSVRPEWFHRVAEADPMRIMAFLVEQYGIKIADDIAKLVASDKPTPSVKYPKF